MLVNVIHGRNDYEILVLGKNHRRHYFMIDLFEIPRNVNVSKKVFNPRRSP